MSQSRNQLGSTAKRVSDFAELRPVGTTRAPTMRVESLSQSKRGHQSGKPGARRARIRDLEPVALFFRHSGLIFRCVGIAGALSLLLAWLMPVNYTAKTAVIVGGGLGQVATISARGDAQNYLERTQELQARNVRLMAEINGDPELTFPAEFDQSKDKPTLAKILDGERMLFTSRRESLEENVDQLKAEAALYDERSTLLGKQIDLIGKQREIADKEVAETQALVDRKLAPIPRLREAQRTSALLASRNVEVEAELLKAKQSANDVRQRITTLKTKYRTEALDEQAKVHAEIREMSTKGNTSRSIAETSGNDSRADAGFIANQSDIITSDQLVRETVRRLGLQSDSSFLAKADESMPIKTEEDRLNAVTAVVQENLAAGRIGPGSRIDIRYTWSKPTKAIEIANTLAAVYVENQAKAEYLPSVSILRAASMPLKPNIAPPIIVIAGLLAGLIFGYALALILDR